THNILKSFPTRRSSDLSGEEVTIDTISGGPDVVPERNRFHVPRELDEVHAKNERMVPGHILTGPIAVKGAEPGDVLEVEILDVRSEERRVGEEGCSVRI